MNTRERVPHAPARAFDFVPLAEQLRRRPAKPQRLACPAIAQRATAGATSVRDSSFEGKKSDGRIAERTRRDGATPVPLPSGSALDLFAPVAQSPERDASNVGDAGGSPAGSAIFPLRGKINGIRNANSAGMSTGPARRACLLSRALLGIRGVWCKSTAFRHCSRSPISRGTTSRTSPVPVRIRPRAPRLRRIAHGQSSMTKAATVSWQLAIAHRRFAPSARGAEATADRHRTFTPAR